MKIYLVRHGKTNSNLKKLFNTEDEDINEIGIQQAETLREKIKDINYDIIISSPLLRAMHTANIANVKNKRIITDDRLKERNPGSLSGQSHDLIDRDEYWNYYSTIQYGTSEKVKDLFKRVYAFLEELKEKDYDTVIIVTHSGVSKGFSAYFEGLGDGKFLNRGLKNCEVKEYNLE